jgi:nucleoid DNA-binding protein
MQVNCIKKRKPPSGRPFATLAKKKNCRVMLKVLVLMTVSADSNHFLFMANLTKRDLVMQISKDTGITQQEVFKVIQQTLDLVTDALASGKDVELRNFGVFEVRLTKSRVGRNPHKPETDVVIPARATVKFKSGKVMRQRVLLRTEELRRAAK